MLPHRKICVHWVGASPVRKHGELWVLPPGVLEGDLISIPVVLSLSWDALG